MKLKFIYTLIITFLSTFSVCFGQDHYTDEARIDNVNYHLFNNENARIVGGDFKGNVIIPQLIKHKGKSYRVVEIGFEALKDSKELISLKLPNSLKKIRSRAFENCTNLQSIVLPSSLESIETLAFLKCTNLPSIHLPKNLIDLGDYAFALCQSLSSITVDEESVIFSSLDGVLYNKDLSCVIKVPQSKTEYVFPESVKEITSSSFQYCNHLTSLDIPESVTKIPNESFYNCSSLKRIYINKNIDFIGFRAFAECASLSEISVDQGNMYFTTVDEILYNYDKTLLKFCPPNKTSVTIEKTTQTIGSYSFSSCNNLVDITLPESVSVIASSSFHNCTALKSVRIESRKPIKIIEYAFGTYSKDLLVWVPFETIDFYKKSNSLYVKELNFKGF